MGFDDYKRMEGLIVGRSFSRKGGLRLVIAKLLRGQFWRSYSLGECGIFYIGDISKRSKGGGQKPSALVYSSAKLRWFEPSCHR